MADQERILEHGLQTMLDLLTGYLANNATRTEWLVEIQKRLTGRNGKLRRGWSDDSIDRKIHKLERLGLITGGRGQGAYYSAVGADDSGPASVRKLPANERLLDALKAAKLQLLNRGKPSAV
jgi:hypothetical protein